LTVTGTGVNVTGARVSNLVWIESGPVSISQVTISGTPKVGYALTANIVYSGSVSNPAVTYRWEKLVGSTWTAISGATSASYTPVFTDANTYLHVAVEGAGANVTGSRTSGMVWIETGAVSISQVTISGTSKVGSFLTANVVYSGSVTNPSVTYKWEKWNGFVWVAIAGATSASYVLVSSDANTYLHVVVAGDGTNVTGSGTSGFAWIT
jgi:hypothetical protein